MASSFSHDSKDAKSNDNLVYFPPKVKPERLKPNGKLLDDAEIAKAYDFMKDYPEGRYSKEWLNRNGIFNGDQCTYMV